MVSSQKMVLKSALKEKQNYEIVQPYCTNYKFCFVALPKKMNGLTKTKHTKKKTRKEGKCDREKNLSLQWAFPFPLT